MNKKHSILATLASLVLAFTLTASSDAAKPSGVTLAFVSSSPAHTDGLIHQGDTVTVDLIPDLAGPITAYGSRDGKILSVWPNVLGDETFELGASQAWVASPGPLDVEVDAVQVVHGRVQVIAKTTFEIAD
jgi:hypothetical protein